MSSKFPRSKRQSSASSELQDLGTTYSAKTIEPLLIERVPITFASNLMILSAFVEVTQKPLARQPNRRPKPLLAVMVPFREMTN
jgi:hypothetical protein